MSAERIGSTGRRAAVITVSDSGAAGIRADTSGDGLEARLHGLGFEVERRLVADDRAAIEGAIRECASSASLVLTTGGTGLGPRDVTPEATLAVVEREAPGFAELMRAEGSKHTVMAYLSRGTAGTVGRCLVVNLPGSPRGSLESLAAIEPLLGHALETIAGPFEHAAGAHTGAPANTGEAH